MCVDTELSKYMFSFSFFSNQPNPIPLLPFCLHRFDPQSLFYIHLSARRRRKKEGKNQAKQASRFQLCQRFEPRTAHISLFLFLSRRPYSCVILSSLVAPFSWARRFRKTAGRASRAGTAEDVRFWCIWRCRVVNWSLAIVLRREYEHSFGQFVQQF